MKKRFNMLVAVVVVAIVLFAGLRKAARMSTADSRFKGLASARVFDPSRNATSDLQTARNKAEVQHKNVLLDVGGNWCPSCILLDRTLRSSKLLRELVQHNYVLVHVNWSSDNQNEAALGRYPKANGYPALYVLAPDGHVIHQQDTGEFEQPLSHGTGYDETAIAGFLVRYAPQP